jgi:ribosomal protein S18 acetylase RimI-like enzyme
LHELLNVAGIGDAAPWRNYLGRFNGEPVAASTLACAAGVAGIYNVVTLPAARGRGIGSAMTLAPLRDARAIGYRVGVLQSSALGVSVYRRIGFQSYCTIERYRWAADA